MPSQIEALKNLWENEKENYKTQEIGSGVQKFVKKVLNSPILFDLKEGRLSTPDTKRRKEFLEEKTKKRKRADAIIFIDPERVIPVEIEKYTNIDAGKKQLFNYQRVWKKKYGILTDGHKWIFYNSNMPVKSFTIDTIFNKPNEFLAFWKEYLLPKNYYLQFFEKIGQLELFEADLTVEMQKENFFSDITTLINSFKDKLNLKGYFKKFGKQESEKKAVEITYAYLIQFILYKTLADNAFEQFDDDFTKRLARIYRDLKNENYSDILNAIKAISNLISKNIYRPFSEEQEFINKKLEDILLQPHNVLSDVTPWLDIFIFIKRYNFANIRNEIFGYVYENYLKQIYEESQKGQYFTDPTVVDFMLEQVGYSTKNLKKILPNNTEKISLIDPACGSGTFLYSAVRNIISAIPNNSIDASKKIEKLINQNIFGLDIEEFPLYLAEMSIIMRMLPLIINERYNNPIEKKIKVFKTKDSISEFLDVAIRNTLSDRYLEKDKKQNRKQIPISFNMLNLGYNSYVRDEDDLKEMKKSLENVPKIQRYRFDFVVGNPPYINYNDCSKQGVLIVKLIQQKEQQMSDIYGVNLNTVPGRIKAYAPKPNIYAFFIALGLSLLKEKGKLCYIIPQSLLISTDLDVMRYHLSQYTTIEKIITFSGQMFIGRGIKQNTPIATSSLILIVNRKTPKKSHRVELIDYTHPNDDIKTCLNNIQNGNKTIKNNILQRELLNNIANWNFIKFDKITKSFFKKYNSLDNFDIYRLSETSHNYFNADFYFDKGLVFPKKKVAVVDNNTKKEYYYLVESEKLSYSLSITNQVIYKSDIRLPKGAQGFKVYDVKYKIIWRYMNPTKFYYSDKKIMVNHNWILISSDNKQEMLYIFSILNSKVSRFVFEKLLKIPNEKSFQIGIKSIKEFSRIPIINNDNKKIKNEIIKTADNILSAEKAKLSDLITFSDVLIQKFDNVLVEKNNLILIKGGKRYKCRIIQNPNLVKKIISDVRNNGLFKKSETISLTSLKNLSAIDYEKQTALKDYIDDLVFSLYFDIKIKKVGVENAEKIKKNMQTANSNITAMILYYLRARVF